MKSSTVGDYLAYLAPELWESKRPPRWPPDAFALAAALLQKSGAYNRVLSRWPPGGKPLKEWVEEIREVGWKWREAWVARTALPRAIQRWWAAVVKAGPLPTDELARRGSLCETLLQLSAAADEASAGVGLPSAISGYDYFEWEAYHLLAPRNSGGSTLCQAVHPSRIRVLPKLHSPQSGLTIRSLSHHLALCPSVEVKPYWHYLPRNPEGHSVNLLVLPWPEATRPAEFRPSDPPPGSPVAMVERYGFFTYDPGWWGQSITTRLRRVMDRAEEVTGSVDGVLFPELSLSARQYQAASREVRRRDAFLIAGVGEPGRNYLRFEVPLVFRNVQSSLEQSKHHRWRLDKSQIIQYGLGGTLDPEIFWWELMALESRRLHFVAMRPWLTVTALICEDLARQDPAAELVRAVGPNLVLALLLDAPQLASRWPARYATVLADDPGSSVLTVTSLGMAQLSRPPNVATRPRVIALWKDAKSGAPVEIELPSGAAGVVLSLAVQYLEEWTADGRSDQGTTGYPILAGVHPLYV